MRQTKEYFHFFGNSGWAAGLVAWSSWLSLGPWVDGEVLCSDPRSIGVEVGVVAKLGDEADKGVFPFFWQFWLGSRTCCLVIVVVFRALGGWGSSLLRSEIYRSGGGGNGRAGR